MADWTVVHKDHSGATIGTYRPENLQFSLEKGENGPHTISYEVSRAAVGAPDFIGPYRTDFSLMRDTTEILAGMHTQLSVNSDEEHCTIGGKGWLHYLERRRWPFDPSAVNAYRYKAGLASPTSGDPPTGYAYAVTGREVMGIVNDLVGVLATQSNSMSMTCSLASISHTVDAYSVDLFDTESIYSKIQALSNENPGEFDFRMDNAKVMHRDAPHRYPTGIDSNSALAEYIFDSSVANNGMVACSFTNNGPAMTRLYGQGASQSATLVSRREYVTASTVYRLLEESSSYDGILDRNTVIGLTRKDLLFGLNPVHEINITVLPGYIANFWTRFFPGVGIWVTADLKAHVIDSAQEIVTMECSVDNEGNEVVQFQCNQIYPDQTTTP